SQQGATFVQRALQHDQPGQKVLAPPRRAIAGLDWQDRGPDLFMQRLEKNLTERGSAVMRGVRVEALAVEHGACVGVDAIRPGAQGDGIRMAETAGAAIGGFGTFYGDIHHRNAMTNPQLWPYPHLDAAAE